MALTTELSDHKRLFPRRYPLQSLPEMQQYLIYATIDLTNYEMLFQRGH